MNKFLIVLLHTYLSRIKSKSFVITTAIFLVFIIALANIQSIMELFDNEETDRIAVIDETEGITEQINNQLSSNESSIVLEEFNGTKEEAEEAVLEEEFQGVLTVSENEENLPEAVYSSNAQTSTRIDGQLRMQLQQIKEAIALNQAGIDAGIMEDIYAPVNFETEMISSGEGTGGEIKTEEELSGARGLVYVMLFLLYFAVITYGNMIAMDIANEKSSRVMEILISSSSPVSQMFAKILGIALLGLTQVGLFIVVGYFMIQTKKDELVGGFFEYFGLADASLATFIYAIVFFLLGYLLYATLSAMLGSLVSRMEDVQQLMMPVILLIVAAFMVAMIGLNMPESSLITITSFIPFFTPMSMFLRVGMLEVPFWEVGLSIVIMIATILILAFIGARVYRGGVLMYGTSTSLKDFKKALQLSKKE
ncbi:ABC transporter permease [Saliterribacillus persicus]|uniref:ABC-2 type transport system permease protein n=1 Tax=Saliterribacillus persicus TaxID=930114 RepID=A0A368XP76_9BACI|nr:ABC transporter permease [Saliterribacillus persicus]RCW69655.1 ABC-2 type transport system permease protein [Saliterribacillus persicus]